MRAEDTGQGYVLGHSEHELARLEQQAGIFADATEEVVRRAGVRAGMHVLDVGCGVGDLSMIAAKIVGPNGAVIGIDRSAEALDVAESRASAARYDWLRFVRGDLNAIDFKGNFDAATGRFILTHLADPTAVVKRLARMLRPGGVLVFVEMDISASDVIPDMELFRRCQRWILELYNKVNAEPDMGSRLYATFRKAGLTPKMIGSSRVEAGPQASIYEYVADSLRTFLPAILDFGIATREEIDIDTLADRLRREAIAGDHCFIFPRLIGAWSRVY